MLEKDLEDILDRYPDLIEAGLRVEGRQTSVGRCRVDLVFRDRFGQLLVTELKRGAILREHIGQLFEYQGDFLTPEDPNVRVMLIGNRVPENMRRSLEHHGFEWREFTVAHLIAELTQRNDAELLERFRTEVHAVLPPLRSAQEARSRFDSSASPEQSVTRDNPTPPKLAPSGRLTIKEKLYHLFGASNIGLTLESRQIVDLVLATFPGTNRTSVIPSDFCYNIVNAGIEFKYHLFEKLSDARYKVLGEAHAYVGPITWKGKRVGEWQPGSRRAVFFEQVAK